MVKYDEENGRWVAEAGQNMQLIVRFDDPNYPYPYMVLRFRLSDGEWHYQFLMLSMRAKHVQKKLLPHAAKLYRKLISENYLAKPSVSNSRGFRKIAGISTWTN